MFIFKKFTNYLYRPGVPGGLVHPAHLYIFIFTYLCIYLSTYLGLEYLVVVFTLLSEVEEGYMLHELEAGAFIPYLINKMGDPKAE